MNQPLDNFFREKLGHANKPAPPAAWDRIEAGLGRRQRKGLWLKIAASVMVVAAASFILWPSQQAADTPGLADQTKKDMPPPSPERNEPAPATMSVPAQSPTVAMTPAPVLKKTGKKLQPAPAVVTKPNAYQPAQQSMAYEAREEQPMTESDPRYDSGAPVQPAPAFADVVLADAHDEEAETEQAVTLVYSANEIDEKYLDKEALAKATSASRKPSTFRKLLAKAYDLKNNQDPMGGLRQRKNEILALNFKSEKRSQNK